ncbi:MAG: PilZ domain-containing protein [Gammaproteobacteria bacterium]|nr:PilZ domain-containing protein [Gammaproteobacteria bacterium]
MNDTGIQTDDRRHFHRVEFSADATLKLPFGVISAEILDISLAGALIQIDVAMALKKGSWLRRKVIIISPVAGT